MGSQRGDLHPLVGTWSITGRTLGADRDDISGRVTLDWAADGAALMFQGDQTIKDMHFRSLEVIWYDAEFDALRAHVYGGGALLDIRGYVQRQRRDAQRWVATRSRVRRHRRVAVRRDHATRRLTRRGVVSNRRATR